MVWYGMVIVYLPYIKGIVKKNASNTTILNTRVYNVWRLHIKNRLGFLLACSGVARGAGGGHLPPGAARRGAPKSCQRILKKLYKEIFLKF